MYLRTRIFINWFVIVLLSISLLNFLISTISSLTYGLFENLVCNFCTSDGFLIIFLF